MSEKAPSLDLNPGAPVARHRRPSLLKGCCWLTALVFAGILTLLLYGFTKSAMTLRKEGWSPHKALYYNTSQEGPADEYLMPIIDNDQLFDIGVTVWVRNTEQEEEEHRLLQEIPEDEDDDPLETPLYSAVPLKGLRLSDTGVTTQVSFKVPTARFRDKNLTSLDLRGSFVIIPASRSPLDHVTTFTSYLEPSLLGSPLPPVKYWPSRPSTKAQLENDSSTQVMLDNAINSLSAQVPLIGFYDVENPCKANHTETSSEASLPVHGSLYIGDTAPSDRQPYVITRTHLRIRKETRPLHTQKVNASAIALGVSSCGRNLFNFSARPRRAKCTRDYKTHGHWETLYMLEYPDAESLEPGVRKEWRYSPYMDSTTYGYGPKDLVRVPVSRHNCSANSTSLPDTLQPETYMNVTWTISFSGITPGKASLVDTFSLEPKPLDSYTEDGAVSSSGGMIAQEFTEMLHALLGHRHHEDDHPRRRVVVHALTVLVDILAGILSLNYWYTRRTTTGICIFAARLAVVVRLADSLRDMGSAMVTETSSALYCLLFLLPLALVTNAGDLAMGATLWTWMLGGYRNWRWLPAVRPCALTHRERTSVRLDRRTPTARKIWFFIALVALYMLYPPWNIWIIAPGTYAARIQLSDTLWIRTVHQLFLAAGDAALLTFNLFQALLNARAGTFAGAHRVVPILGALRVLLGWSLTIKRLVGRTETHAGISVDSVVVLASWAVLAGQGMWLPGVKQDATDETD